MSAHRSRILLAALLASATAGAAPTAKTDGGAAPEAYRGAYTVSFTMNVGASRPPGTIYLCKARAVPPGTGFEGLRLQSLPASSGEAAGAVLSSTWVNCTVEIPFYWIAGGGLATLSYEIDAVSGDGGQTAQMRKEEGIGIPLPAPGGMMRINFNVNF